MSGALANIDAARRALDKARTVNEVKDVRDKAEAIRLYLKKQKGSFEAQNAAAELKIRAERKLGELIPEKVKRGPKKKLHDATYLSDLGIEKTLSSRCQRINSILEPAFEKKFAELKDGGEEITTQHFLRLAKDFVREKKRRRNREIIETAAPVQEQYAGETFPTIVIDPPWDWGDEGDVDQLGRARPTYGTMSFDEIKALPVGELSEKSAHIYLWITNRSLPKGFSLLEEWGFRYVTCLTWCKPSFGMGNYFRGSTEQILFGVKGSLELLRKDVGTWFQAKRPSKKHSSKPDEFYQLVESCSPGVWLEMFARKTRPGWKTWGAEVCNTVSMSD